MKAIITILIFIWLVISIIGCSFRKSIDNDNFENYDRILMYEFQVPTESNYPNDKELIGKLIDSNILMIASPLSSDEINTFNNFLNSESSFNDNAAICWEPHLGIYFLREDTIVNYLEISLDCNRMMSAKKIPFLESKEIDGINIPRGISPDFRKFLISLMKKYNFNHPIPSDTRYD